MLKIPASLARHERPIFVMGMIFLGISLILYTTPWYRIFQYAGGAAEGLAFIHYGLAAIFFGTIVIQGFAHHNFKLKRISYRLYHLSVLLFGISAFALNRPEYGGSEFTVFGRFAPWVEPAMFLGMGGILLNIFREQLPDWMRHATMLLSGMGAALALYFVIFLLPTLPIGLIGAIVFGISLHLFAPIWVLGAFIKVFRQGKGNNYRLTFALALAVPLCFTTYYVMEWSHFKHDIEKAETIALRQGGITPDWVQTAQFLRQKPLTGHFLEFTYGVGAFWRDPFRGGLFGGRTRDKGHDPLVSVAQVLVGSANLKFEDREKVAASMVDLRHATARRLWSDAGLETSKVHSRIEVFPEYRLAYNEKTLTIHREPVPDNWSNNQPREAVYTFRLPEGSVATSLSLWVNGKERQSRLSSRKKADSAYATIVGVEVRDPALLHWQEGNALTVTVFPCNIEEDRKFKIGITTPLEIKGDLLELENVLFEGPEASGAEEIMEVVFRGKTPENLDLPGWMTQKETGRYEMIRRFDQDWSITMKAPTLSSNAFVFDGWEYRLKPLQVERPKVQLDQLYLDLDKGWTKEEYNQIIQWANVHHANVFVFTDSLKRVFAENQDQLFEEAGNRNFGLFPFFTIEYPARSLFITKSTRYSPDLSSLLDHPFGEELTGFFESGEVIRTWHFGEALSPYLRTLKEFRHLDYARGDLPGLFELLDAKTFPSTLENAKQVAVHSAEMMVTRDSLSSEHGGGVGAFAPDHLMRLFAYNHILEMAGPRLLQDQDALESDWVEEAEKAFVVTPVTSLLVLETDEDYKKYGIEENEGSVGNAKALSNAFTKGEGAVPEPHEWALILLTLCFAGWLWYRKKTRLA